MSLPTLLFDLDGTLTDPAPGFLASIHYALNSLGLASPPDEELVQYIGPPLRNSMGTLLGTEDETLIEEAVELYRWRLDNGGKFEATVIEGIPEVLKHFADKGHDLYVCTGKPTGVATEIVTHFGLSLYFKNIYGADLDGAHCDKAELIRYIWKMEKIQSPEGIMIGDTIYDICGAKANKMGAIAVNWGFGFEKDLAEAGADIFVSSALELIPAIETLVEKSTISAAQKPATFS